MNRLTARLSVAALGAILASCAGHDASLGGVPPVGGTAANAPSAAGLQNALDLERAPIPVAAPAGDVPIAVVLPMRNRAELEAKAAQIGDPSSPQFRHFLTRQYIADTYDPRPADLEAVAAQLRAAGFSTQTGAHAVFAWAPSSSIASFFGTTITGVQYTSRTGEVSTRAVAQTPLRLPQAFAALGAHVVGLDNRAPFETFSQIAGVVPPGRTPDSIAGKYGPYYPPDLRQAYHFPSVAVANGSGVTIAIVIDAQVRATDVAAFSSYALNHRALAMSTVKIAGGGPLDTGEGTLDVEQSGGIAPGASIDVYSIPALSDSYVLEAYDAAYNNSKVLVVNSSFGQCEADFDNSSGISYLNDVDGYFVEGSAVGMTWVAASGDWSAFGCPDGSLNKVGVMWPASDPNVLSVGGTDLETTHAAGNYASAYYGETAYDYAVGGGKYWGSGGGYSGGYARPSWQYGFVSSTGRGVPDLSLHMGCCPGGGAGRSTDASSDYVYLAGKWVELIGTSAASPDIVGLVALRDELQRSGQGDMHAWIYAEAKHAGMFRRAIRGNNGYSTNAGYWDPVLGLGTPVGSAFAGTGYYAGVPGTATNPGR